VAYKTDGLRLYAACIQQDVPNGDYEVCKRTKSEIVIMPSENDMDWPDVDSILNKVPNIYQDKKFHKYVDKGSFSHPISFNVHVESDLIGKSVGMFYLDLYENEHKPLINADYVKDALSGFDYCDVWFKDDKDPVFFIDQTYDRVAVVMPMRKFN
jgi:hypothetical protein